LYPVLLLLVAGGLYAWQRDRNPPEEPLEGWLKRVDDPHVGGRIPTATALGQFGRDSHEAPAAPPRMSLHDAHGEVQKQAVLQLQTLCQQDTTPNKPTRLARKRKTIQTVLDALDDDDDALVRTRAPDTLYHIAGLEFHDRAVVRGQDDEVDREMRPI